MFKATQLATTIITFLAITITTPLATEDVTAEQKEWTAFGEKLAEKDPDMQSERAKKDPLYRARAFMSKVTKQMAKKGMLPKTGITDRVFRPLSGYRCGEIERILSYALDGASIGKRPSIVVDKGTPFNLADPNRNHTAITLRIDDKYYMFDPWQHGSETDTFDGFEVDNKWNGMPQEDWFKTMREQNYILFRRLGSEDPFYPIMDDAKLDDLKKWHEDLQKELQQALEEWYEPGPVEQELSPHDSKAIFERVKKQAFVAPDGGDLLTAKLGQVTYTYYIKDGKNVLHGTYTVHHLNGALGLICVYNHGIPVFKRSWRDNGYAEWVHPLDSTGKMNGVQRAWWKNGELHSEIPWVDSQKHGLQTEYYSNGKLNHQIEWDKGVKKRTIYPNR